MTPDWTILRNRKSGVVSAATHLEQLHKMIAEADLRPTACERPKPKGQSGESCSGQQGPVGEWLVAALGPVLVVASTGFLVYQAFAVKETPPEITFLTKKTTETKTGFLRSCRCIMRAAKQRRV